MPLITSGSSDSLVKSEIVSPGVLLVTLNPPDKLNALSKALLGSLAALLEAADHNDEIKCVVLIGGERAFSVEPIFGKWRTRASPRIKIRNDWSTGALSSDFQSPL